MSTTITIRNPRKSIKEVVLSIIGALSGNKTSSRQSLTTSISTDKTFRNSFGQALLEKIHEAYLQKANHSSDQTGIKWKELQPSTIARRSVTQVERKTLLVGTGRQRGLLTADQNRLWKGIFASNFHKLAPVIGNQKAKIKAATMAWAILKARGAKTKIGTLGRRRVLIGIDTSRLIRSYTPGRIYNGRYYKPKDQIFELRDNALVIGSKVPYSGYFDKKRTIIPKWGRMVAAGWIKYAIGVAARESILSIQRDLRGNI